MSKTLQLVKRDFFTALPFWTDLNAAERQAVESHTRALAVAMAGQAQTRLEMGEHLMGIRAVLEKKRCFRKYVVENLRFGWRTAYRYMRGYQTTRDRVPDYALRLAAARGIDLVGIHPERPFGSYTEAVKRLPVPKAEAAVPEWLEKLEAARRAQNAKKGPSGSSRAPEARMIRVYRYTTGQYGRVKEGGTSSAHRWGLKLLGVLLTEFGLPAQRIEPVDIPDGFKAVLGRPRKK